MGVPIIRIIVYQVYIGVPLFWKTTNSVLGMSLVVFLRDARFPPSCECRAFGMDFKEGLETSVRGVGVPNESSGWSSSRLNP